MHFYAFNIGDYASHTRHLTHMEDLAYRRLLDLYYLHEQPLNARLTVVARLINMREFESEVQAVLEEFFDLIEGTGWVHHRADDEISKYHGKLEAASRAGKASAQRRFNDRSTTVQPNKKQSQETRNNPIKEKEAPAPVVAVPDLEETVVKVKGKKSAPDYSDEDFNRFWEAYGYDAGRHKALKAWRVIKPSPELTEKIIDAAWIYNKANPEKTYYKHATTWLNGKHWNDDPSTLLPKIARIAAKTQHQLNQEATARSLFGSSVPNRIIDMEVTNGSAENATPRLG